MLASNKLIESLINVGRTLNNRHVDYLIVGGTAVAYYGYFRHSITMAGIPADRPDVDIWYNPSYSNYFKLLDALADLGRTSGNIKTNSRPIRGNRFSNTSSNISPLICYLKSKHH